MLYIVPIYQTPLTSMVPCTCTCISVLATDVTSWYTSHPAYLTMSLPLQILQSMFVSSAILPPMSLKKYYKSFLSHLHVSLLMHTLNFIPRSPLQTCITQYCILANSACLSMLFYFYTWHPCAMEINLLCPYLQFIMSNALQPSRLFSLL